MNRKAEIQCIVLGKLGKSYAVIEATTGLTKDQIYKTLKTNNALVTDWRNGRSDLSRKMITYVANHPVRALAQIESKKLLT